MSSDSWDNNPVEYVDPDSIKSIEYCEANKGFIDMMMVASEGYPADGETHFPDGNPSMSVIQDILSVFPGSISMSSQLERQTS
jgi:hypothetical protein